jgi:hypothetical protein
MGKPRRWVRRAGRTALGLVVLAAAWLALALRPQPLFAHSLQRANVVLHARAPLPPEAGPLLDEVVRRVARSPLYDPARVHDVFLCDTPSLFALFALWDRNAGAVAQIYLGGNVFLRPTSIARGTIIGPSGNETRGDRTLAYFIAHEVTHAMTADHTGRWGYHRLGAFQQEGYADHVAFARPIDFAGWRAALVRDEREMSPARSGLYRRYELMVAYLLERRGMPLAELLARRLDHAGVEAQLLADATIE